MRFCAKINCIAKKSPFGNPACSANAAKANAVNGVSSAGFKTMVHPAASAAPA